MAVHKATNGPHLLKRPNTPTGVAEASDPEPSEIIDTPLSESGRNHPFDGKAPAAS